MTRKPIPPHMRQSRNGRTIREAAAVTGLTEQTIKRWTSEPRDVYLSRAAQRRELIRDMRAQGLTMRAIADALDISVATVHAAMHHSAAA